MLRRGNPNDPQPSITANPLVASVLRENVRVEDGKATIGLWEEWPALLAEVPAFGNVLAISRNSYAVLGTISRYPDLDLVPCGQFGCAADGSLDFDFSTWQRAVAIVESRGRGWLYSVEFSDLDGEVIHKICLTDQSDFETFRAWIEVNQIIPTVPSRRGSARYSSWLENSLLLDASGAEPLRIEAVRVFVQMATAEGWSFRAIVGNSGAVQIAQINPTTFRRSGQWIFAGDDISGIHLRVQKSAEVFLHNVRGCLALKACDAAGRLVCAIAPPHDPDLEDWNAKLRKLSGEFSTDRR
jgi:putative heme degradation protein